MITRKWFWPVVSAVFLIIVCISFSSAENYPEFVGNYIKCDTGWCELSSFKMNTLSFIEGGRRMMVHAGFFKVPHAYETKERKPRIVLYSGKSQADPSRTALVELSRMPYNGASVADVDNKTYSNVRYTKENVRSELWTYKREIPLKFKPVEGKVGMFLYEPAETLTDGLYVLDSGMPGQNGHKKLSVQPNAQDFFKIQNPPIVVTIIVGSLSSGALSSKQETTTDAVALENKTTEAVQGDSGQQQQPLEKSVNKFIKGIFGQ